MSDFGSILLIVGFWLGLIVAISVSLTIIMDIHDRWQQRVRRHDQRLGQGLGHEEGRRSIFMKQWIRWFVHHVNQVAVATACDTFCDRSELHDGPCRRCVGRAVIMLDGTGERTA